CADFYRDVVSRDHVLGRDVERHDAQIDPHRTLEDRDDENNPRPAEGGEPPEAKDHCALVLVEHLESAQQDYYADHDDYSDCRSHRSPLPSPFFNFSLFNSSMNATAPGT